VSVELPQTFSNYYISMEDKIPIKNVLVLEVYYDGFMTINDSGIVRRSMNISYRKNLEEDGIYNEQLYYTEV
jgi:hypothetical protein